MTSKDIEIFSSRVFVSHHKISASHEENENKMRRLIMFIGALTLIAAGCTKKEEAKPEPVKTDPAKAEPAKTEAAKTDTAAPAKTDTAGTTTAAKPAEPAPPPPATKKLFLDVHDHGKVKAKDVVEVHKKDLATEGKYGVDYLAYWVDEKNGKVYCLSESPSADAASTVHKEAHGLMPSKIMEVSADNANWKPTPGKKLFMDVHHMG